VPIYEFCCPNCGENASIVFHVNDEHIANCSNCGAPMKKDYQSMIPVIHDVPVDSVDHDLTGKPIVYHTRGQLKKIAKEHGCSVDFGPNGSREVNGR